MLSPRPPAAHILAYAQTLDGGGVERALLRLVRAWNAHGRRVTLVVGDTHGAAAGTLPEGVETHVLGTRSMLGLGATARLTAQIAPDIVFCPGNHYTGIAAWVRLRLGGACPPIVAKISNALDRRDHKGMMPHLYRAWLRWHPRFIDRLVAMSPAMAVEAQATIGGNPAMVRVIPNPPVVRAAHTAPPPLPAGRFLIGVGRLVPQKRWDRLIAAFALVAVPDVALTIFGEGPERAALQAQVAALGLAGRVTLPGQIADPASAIARAAALALVSDFEGVPGVLREALAVGTPVVATESSVAVREIVTRPALGSVVQADDMAGLVAALDDWLAPGRARPAPVPEPGADAAWSYLDLFDRLVLDRRVGRSR